jgi:hypothetical protein
MTLCTFLAVVFAFHFLATQSLLGDFVGGLVCSQLVLGLREDIARITVIVPDTRVC